jgi:glutamate racemase
MTQATINADAPIGVFDSGVGGLSVLRHIRALLPRERLLYFADSGCAPYGDKPEAVVAARSLAVADFLVAQGAKALVVACNTATVAAIKLLRAHYPDLPIVGVEPGLKPGAAASRNGKVGVLATDLTLAGEKFLLLRDQVSQASAVQFVLQGCTGLVDRIELGELDSHATRALLERYLTPMLDQGVDTIVLGCTHYPFVQAAIAAIVARATTREVVLVDTGDAVARQLARLLAGAGALRAPEAAPAVAETVPAARSPGACTQQAGAATHEAEPATLAGYTSASAPALAAAFSGLLGIDVAVRAVTIGDDLAPPP